VKKNGRGCKEKGNRGERELVELLRAMGATARRVPLSGATEDFKGDVLLEIEPGSEVQLEVKRRNQGFSPIYRWLTGAFAVCFRGDRQEWLITLRLVDLPKIAAFRRE
jgi:hypothetical protein